MEINEKLQFVIDENGYKHFLEKEIGRGGQGIVWKTKDPNIIVKMKIDKITGEPVTDEDEYVKYKAELDEVRILDLPEYIHIAKPVSLLQKPYCGYVMRLLDDMKSIKYWIRPFDGTVNPIEFYIKSGGLRHRLELLTNIAEIFTKLYSHSAVYADLSPNNIFASSDNNSSEVWLIDADNMRYRYDVEKEIMTPGYGAPEVVKGGINTLESDEYSFAILAHEILTLNSPFNGKLVTDSDSGWDDDVDNSVLAEEGELPWIYDPEDDSNRCITGISEQIVLNETIKSLFEKNFNEEGRHNPLSRPKMRDWYTALKQAQDYTVKCKYCGNTFFMTKADANCPFCKTGRSSERAKVIFSQIIDEYMIDDIVSDTNDDIEKFNNYGERCVEGISKDDIKTSIAVCCKLFDMYDGKYYFYNYHTDDISFSEEKNITIEIEIINGTYTIRNLSDRNIEISSRNSSYGVIAPQQSKRLDDINNIILSMPMLHIDEDILDDNYIKINDLNKLRKRHIKFYVI